MFRFRFIDSSSLAVIADTSAISAAIKWKLNQSADWSASFPKNLLAVQEITEGNTVEIYYKNRLLLEGILQSVDEKWGGDQFILNLQGRGRLDQLYDNRAYSQAYYQDKEVLLILGELLRRAGWRLGYIDTLPDKTLKLTLDMRTEKRLLPQITQVITGIPGVFYRYGGKIADKHAVDIGEFLTDSGVALYRPPDGELVAEFGEGTGAVQSISSKVTLTEIVNSVEVIGGDVKDSGAVTRAINLKDALTADPTLATDPDFPILTEIANFVYYIRNNAIPIDVGSQSVERYTQYKPPTETGNATLAATNAAGLALYQRGVAFLRDHSENITEYTVNASGDNLFVEVGDTLYLKGSYRQPIIDPFSDEITLIESSVDADLRVIGLNLGFSDDKVTWDYDLTDGGTLVSQEDLFVTVYDETKRDDPPAGTVYAPTLAPVLETILTTQTGGSADTTMEDGTPAKLVEILPVSNPASQTGVYLAGIPYGTSPEGTLLVELVTDPTFTAPSTYTPAVVKIALRGAQWISAYSANLTTHFVHY